MLQKISGGMSWITIHLQSGSKYNNLPFFSFAEDDGWVPVEESITKYKQATVHLEDVTMIQIKGTDHLMYNTHDQKTKSISEEYIDTMITWLMKHIG